MRGSFLGLAWTVLYPLALLLVSTMMFAWFLRVPTQGIPAALFLYCGLTPWLFSNNTIQNSAFALFANLQLVKNASFPREILPLATLFVGVVDFAVSAILLVGMVLYYRLPISATLLLVPFLIVDPIDADAGAEFIRFRFAGILSRHSVPCADCTAALDVFVSGFLSDRPCSARKAASCICLIRSRH